jgi:hypothetical protein
MENYSLIAVEMCLHCSKNSSNFMAKITIPEFLQIIILDIQRLHLLRQSN